MPKMTTNEIDDALEAARTIYSVEIGYDEILSDYDDYNDSISLERPGFAALSKDGRISEVSMEEWAKAFATPRRVAHTNISGVVISTVFVGVNFGLSAPLWFETLVFGGPLDELCDRYATLDDAIIGHNVIVATIKDAIRDANVRLKANVERTRRHNVVR